jgi:tRNA (mo5U34)-methyltransferase
MVKVAEFARDATAVERLRAAVANRAWFHTIDLGDGVCTPGLDDSPFKLRTIGMPADLTDKRVLDIGAIDGFFSFEAERRGGAVLATDHYGWTGPGILDKRGFDLAKQALHSRVEERTLRVEDLSSAGLGQFDVVLFLGVLYHATDPLGYLSIVRSLTRGFAIIETVVDMLEVARPALAYYPGSTFHGDPTNFFAPNEAAVEGMCKDVGFSRVETVQAERYVGRMAFHAYV